MHLRATSLTLVAVLLAGCGGGGSGDPAGTSGPTLTAMFPSTTYAGASTLTLSLLGTGFTAGTTVSFGGTAREATVVSATHLVTTIQASELAGGGSLPVKVIAPDGTPSGTSTFTLLTLAFGETSIATPDWTAETHGKLAASTIAANLPRVFDPARVQRMDVTIDPANWAAMQSNLASLRAALGNSNDFSRVDDPVYVPCDVRYDGKQWYRVGIRFKGNSSLYHAAGGKLPLKLKFNEFGGVYPAVANQRFFGVKSLSLKSNYRDESAIRETVATQLFRDFGLVGPNTAPYELYVDTGSGPVYHGLYTLVEEVDDTVVKTRYADSSANLYKPEESPATFAAGSFGTYWMGKKSNEDALDYADVQELNDAVNSVLRTADRAGWKDRLEAILDVPIFLRWLAANQVLQNWDTYGVGAHNYYLYRNPATGRFEWIPWDNNEALASNDRCLSLDASEVTSAWPLIRYLLDDPAYAAEYRQRIREFAGTLFNASRMVPIYVAQSALVQDSVLREGAGYTFTSATRFPAAIEALKTQVAAREAAALAY